ncbi:hypothetical protein [Streptomyces sp. EKS3.2]|uniref:hypothetical protein n=1 Tax=Streptomyces sp. EKS3.2 TaxID=3461008 RepID=UPI004042033F
MSLDQPIAWTAAHPWHAALLAGVLVTIGAIIVRRTSGAVLTAGIGALVCTAYSGDTSWRFAEHRLGMASVDERLVMFAAGEIALLACAVMARANKKATATSTEAGTPGVPGVLVWCITGIQIIPAYSESGFWAGTVRAVLGPVMAALLWHLAMGLEIRVTRPDALSTGLPAQIGHELRERLLSHLGLAVRGRTAAQVTRDRATARAVRLASRKHLGPWGRAALKAAVARSGAAVNGEQRHQLMQLLAARRNAGALRDVPVVSPWVVEPVPDPYPATTLGVTGAALRRMDPVDAVLLVHAAHPDRTPAELAALATEYGVPVTEAMVNVALHAAPKTSGTPILAAPGEPTAPLPEPADRPQLAAVPDPDEQPAPEPAGSPYPAAGLHLDVITEPEVRPEFAAAVPAETARTRRTRTEVHPVPVPETGPVPAPDPVPDPPGTPDPDVPADPSGLLARAHQVDTDHRRAHDGRPASIKTLKRELRVGQTKAQQIRAALDSLSGKAPR